MNGPLDDLSHLMDEQAHLEQSSTQLSNHSEKHELDSTSPEPCQVLYIFFGPITNALSFYRSKIILDLFWIVQTILDGSSLFWLGLNNCRSDFRKLVNKNLIWTWPKL